MPHMQGSVVCIAVPTWPTSSWSWFRVSPWFKGFYWINLETWVLPSALELKSVAFSSRITRIKMSVAFHFNNTFLSHRQSSERLYIACSILSLKSRLFFWAVQITFLQCIESLNHLLRVRSLYSRGFQISYKWSVTSHSIRFKGNLHHKTSPISFQADPGRLEINQNPLVRDNRKQLEYHVQHGQWNTNCTIQKKQKACLVPS